MTDRHKPAPAPRFRFEPLHPESAATTLELFFDLVFVFALTQITAFMAHDVGTERLVQGLLVLGLLWWSWTGYAWLGNVVKADEGATRIAMLTAMAAMFVIALAIPEAFDDSPGGISSPYAIAVCYFVLRTVHIAAFWAVAAGDAGLRRQLARFGASMLVATGLLITAAAASGNARTWLWVGVLIADYLGTFLGGAGGWRLPGARHFAERHGLIVIVALGESVVAIGVGVSDRPFSGSIVAASLLGLVLTGALWWLYFDTSALRTERALAEADDVTRARMGRDAFSLLHLPIVAGIVLLALGMKKVLEYVADTEHHDLSDPLEGVALAALVLGVVVYLLGQAAYYYRCTATLKVFRVSAAVLLLPLLAAGPQMPAMATLGVLAAVVALMAAWETHVFAADRHELRHSAHPEPAHHAEHAEHADHGGSGVHGT
ncbi:MAG TPA: low temperature requirement protein A [Sporichthya sp.]|nr:low temperature requirement protein A [Sporichthya sp.]